MTSTAHDDEDALVDAARAGDAGAFEQLYRAHVGRVYGLCLRLSGDPTEAQDCAQDTFVKAWRSLDSFRGNSRFGTWLHRIAVNHTLGRHRHHAMEIEKLKVVHREQPAPELHEDDRLAGLEEAIMTLPERARAVFVLQKIYGYTHEQTADMLDIAVGTCKTQAHRASKLLAEILRGEGDTPARDEAAGTRPGFSP